VRVFPFHPRLPLFVPCACPCSARGHSFRVAPRAGLALLPSRAGPFRASWSLPCPLPPVREWLTRCVFVVVLAHRSR
jgi:hypothetical protein